MLAISGKEKLFVRNIFFHKNMVGESSPPSWFLKEKRRSAKSDVSKVLFPDIGKITNLARHTGLQLVFLTAIMLAQFN